MIGVLALSTLIHLEGWQEGGGLHVGVQVGEDELQGSTLSRGHTTHLLEGTVTMQHFSYTDLIKIPGQTKVYFIIWPL